MRRRIASALLLVSVLAVAMVVPPKKAFDWSAHMPPGFRLVAYSPAKSDLQIAWEDGMGVPTWTYETRQGNLEEVTKDLLGHLGPEWHEGVKGYRIGEPNLVLSNVMSDPRRVRIRALGERSEPSALAQWAASHLPLDQLGLVQAPEGRPIVDNFGASECSVITRRH